MTDSPELRDRQRRLLREMMQQPEERISLAQAALVIAAGEYRDLDSAKYIRRLDAMAERVRGDAGDETDPLQTIARINRYLYEEEGFSGNSEDYYDPRNSFLNEVLDRKTGIPITLSTVYLEIAERLRLPLVGVGMPGHFLVKHRYFDILIDPFAKGRILTEAECRRQMKEKLGQDVPFHRAYLAGVGKRHIIARMLNNLRGIYVHARQFQKALNITEMSFTIHPASSEDWKQRAAILVQLQRHSEAAADLSRYLDEEPAAEDAKEIRQILISLRKTLAQWN